MRRTVLSFIILTISGGCTKINKKTQQHEIQKTPRAATIIAEKIRDSLNLKEQFLDTTNIKTSPVKILSAKLLKNAYSDHKDIELIYKNVSNEDIKSIKFEWYCENAFDKPASGRNFYIKGKTTGNSTIYLKKQQTQTKIWEDFSTDANTIISARPYEILYSNGSKWILEQSIYKN